MKTLRLFIIKEFQQFVRDKKMVTIILIAPVIQLIFLGYAANRDLKDIKTIVFDKDDSYSSREFIRRFEESGYFLVVSKANTYEKITEMLDKGAALTAIVIDENFEKDIKGRNTSKVQMIFDGSDGNKASIAAGYAQNILAEYSSGIAAEYLEKSGMITLPAGSVSGETRVWYNPNLVTRLFMLPSIVGLILIIITTNLTALAIVKEREIGTLEQLIVTPIKPYQMIFGKLIPFSILGFIAILIVLSVMRYWFEIQIKGSVGLLILSSFVFMLSTLGLGLFISTISKSQQQAMITSSFLIIIPMIFLSGFAFPIENMPVIIQYITYIIPLKYFIIIIRAIVLKGLGFSYLWKEILILFSMGMIILILSSLRFKKKLE
ncbi:MAG: putative multidrug ABC transporter permease YbhR [Ignavibacteria bacterium]|nr:putative multidrug ABC transporter permease YbhR [Ignavibacteria bacterium]